MELAAYSFLPQLVEAGPKRSGSKPSAALRVKTAAFAGPILAARNPDHLESLVDAQIESEHFENLLALVSAAAKLKKTKVTSDFRPVLSYVLGPDCNRLVEEIHRLQSAIDEAIQAARRTRPPGLNSVVGLLPDLNTRTTFLTDARVPSLVAKGALGGLRATAYMAAVMHAAMEEERLTAWLAHSIAKNWITAGTLYLQLLASLPGVSVAEDLIPNRLDLRRLQDEADATASAMDRALNLPD